MWIFYALLSAFTAALVAILSKLGLKSVDPTLATTIRGIIMAVFLFLTSLSIGKFNGFSFKFLSSRDWILIVLAGVAGALSWLFYFLAIKMGDVVKVVVIDRLSLVFVIILALLFLGEQMTWKSALGAGLMVLGAILISLK